MYQKPCVAYISRSADYLTANYNLNHRPTHALAKLVQFDFGGVIQPAVWRKRVLHGDRL